MVPDVSSRQLLSCALMIAVLSDCDTNEVKVHPGTTLMPVVFLLPLRALGTSFARCEPRRGVSPQSGELGVDYVRILVPVVNTDPHLVLTLAVSTIGVRKIGPNLPS